MSETNERQRKIIGDLRKKNASLRTRLAEVVAQLLVERGVSEMVTRDCEQALARAERAEAELSQVREREAGMRRALERLLKYAERNECEHSSTHRGGTIWTICDDCGWKWADDEGGFRPYSEPPEITEARAALAPAPATVYRCEKCKAEVPIPLPPTGRTDLGRCWECDGGKLLAPAPATEGEPPRRPDHICGPNAACDSDCAAYACAPAPEPGGEHGPEKRCRFQSNDVRDPICGRCHGRKPAAEKVKQYPPNAGRHWTDHLCRECGGLFHDCQGIHT